MGVRILFLGPLADLKGRNELTVTAPLDWTRLLDIVSPEMKAQLESDRVRIACAGKVLAHKADLLAVDGDEVAVLPPVSGG